MLDNIKGALLGHAVGDAMGVATEFMSPAQIKEEYGTVKKILGGGVFGFKRGETSDDTAMTIAVAKGIIANSRNPIEEIGKQFIEWKKTQPKDIGMTVARSLQNYNADWFEAAKMTHGQQGQSGGNGTLMRCLPIALAYSDLVKIEELSVLQSKMTHYEDSASEACIIYNRIARRVLLGEDLKTSIKEEIKNTRYDIDYTKQPDCSPSGYVVDTLKWVFYWLLNKETFDEVIVGAVNMGDDSDTIAAIAGGLKGLEVGSSKVYPSRELLNYKLLEELAELIYHVRDVDTEKIQEKQDFYVQELVNLTDEFYELTEKEVRVDETGPLLNSLNENVFLYRASLAEDALDFEKKYKKWRTVWVRLRRSRRLLQLQAPTNIIQNEVTWLVTEVDHLNQIQQGLEPQYTSYQLEDLEALAEVEREMEEE